MHHRGVKMAKISKPFWRPSALTHIVHIYVGKLGLRTTKSGAYRLALNNMASNREGALIGPGPSQRRCKASMQDARSTAAPSLRRAST